MYDCVESQQEMNLDNLSGTVPGNAEQMLGADDKLRRLWEYTFRKVQDEPGSCL